MLESPPPMTPSRTHPSSLDRWDSGSQAVRSNDSFALQEESYQGRLRKK